jgi:hypothetical protein
VTKAEVRRVRFGVHAFEAWIAVAAVVSAVTYFFGVPGVASATVSVVSPGLAACFSALYGLGGVGVLVGLWAGSPRIEGAGLNLLAAGIVVAAVGLVAVLGTRGLVSGAIQAGAAVCCAVRLRMLVKGTA